MADIFAAIANTSPSTDTEPRARIRRLVGECVGADLTSWERHEFLPSIANQFSLSDKQEKLLSKIEIRILGEAA